MNAQDLWYRFTAISKSDGFNLPSDGELQSEYINNAIALYNNRALADNHIIVVVDDFGDMVQEDGTEFKDKNIFTILAYYLKLVFLDNQIVYYTTLYKPFTDDIGISAMQYKTDLDSLNAMKSSTQRTIDTLFANINESLF